MQIAYDYDHSGNLKTVTPTGSGSSPWTSAFGILPQFHPVGGDIDNFNRVAVVDNATTKNIITVEPDPIGLTSTLKYGDYAAVVRSVTHAYDKYLRVSALYSNEAFRVLDITLARDFIGNILSHVEPANPPVPSINYLYTYDGMNRLISGEGDTEAYEELSNLAVRGSNFYIYQDPSEPGQEQMRLAQAVVGGVTYTYGYDSNGNISSVQNKFASVSYDNLNNLRQIVYAGTDKYWYNAAGYRVKKTEDVSGANLTTYTMFDGENPVLQEIYHGATRIQTTFNIVITGKILAQYKCAYGTPNVITTVYFYLDNLNSRRVVISSVGAVVNRYRYSPWGLVTEDVNNDPTNYESYTQKDYDASGLIYFNARYYDPTTGRFLTEDPSRKGVNWYAYCDNNPVNLTDPDGRDPPQHKDWTGKIDTFLNASAANIMRDIERLKAQNEKWYASMTAPPSKPPASFSRSTGKLLPLGDNAHFRESGSFGTNANGAKLNYGEYTWTQDYLGGSFSHMSFSTDQNGGAVVAGEFGMGEVAAGLGTINEQLTVKAAASLARLEGNVGLQAGDLGFRFSGGIGVQFGGEISVGAHGLVFDVQDILRIKIQLMW
jgi:RHS repeat-associated protein